MPSETNPNPRSRSAKNNSKRLFFLEVSENNKLVHAFVVDELSTLRSNGLRSLVYVKRISFETRCFLAPSPSPSSRSSFSLYFFFVSSLAGSRQRRALSSQVMLGFFLIGCYTFTNMRIKHFCRFDCRKKIMFSLTRSRLRLHIIKNSDCRTRGLTSAE